MQSSGCISKNMHTMAVNGKLLWQGQKAVFHNNKREQIVYYSVTEMLPDLLFLSVEFA